MNTTKALALATDLAKRTNGNAIFDVWRTADGRALVKRVGQNGGVRCAARTHRVGYNAKSGGVCVAYF